MPGYDRTRIVDWKSEDLDEFACPICQDILNDPVFTKCCRQSYCRPCIDEWLSKNNTCPSDRTRLSASDFSSPPRIITNIISKMKIKCENWQLGCVSVVALEDIKIHTENCQYGLCPLCKTSIKPGDHDCVENLLIQIDSLKIENNDLRMKNSVSKDNNQAVGSSQVINKFQKEIKNCNKDNYQLLHNRPMPLELERTFISVCQRMLQNHQGKSVLDFCKIMFNTLNSLPPSRDRKWNVVAFVDEGGQSCVSMKQYFAIRFGKVIFEIFN